MGVFSIRGASPSCSIIVSHHIFHPDYVDHAAMGDVRGIPAFKERVVAPDAAPRAAAMVAVDTSPARGRGSR